MKTLSLENVLYILLYIVSCFGNKSTNFRFASYYGDHMVLQKAPQRAIIWGYSSQLSSPVWISLDNNMVGITITRRGSLPDVAVWSFQLPAKKAGGPYTITVDSFEGEITLFDVLFGDVWICSGQSNMQMTLSMADNAAFEILNAAKHPDVRLFTVDPSSSKTPEYDFISVAQNWSIPNIESVGQAPWTYFSAVCWLYGKYLSSVLNYPIGLIATSYGGTLIEPWSSQDALNKCPHRYIPSGLPDPNIATVVWNAMVQPLLNMTIYGVIWYQGESNALPGLGTDSYSCRFPAMIDDWRDKFAEGSNEQTSRLFPFGFVQLAPWRDNYFITTGFPDIRWHQTADYGYVPNDRMNNVFMAVAMDLPDFYSPYGSIHPRDKQDVAKRLCTEALAVGYGMTALEKIRGPFPSDFEVLSNTVNIVYNNNKMEIENRSPFGFEVCCIQQGSNPRTHCGSIWSLWLPVSITASNSTSVAIYYGASCGTIWNPVLAAIRYAWRESPCMFKNCAVYNKVSGFPAPPFIQYFNEF